MSKGVVICARNSTFDYARLARLNQRLIQRYLGLPVSVVTDSETAATADFDQFDQVIVDDQPDSNRRVFDFGDRKVRAEWKNGSRLRLYDLTPYEQTLVIDADYLIFSDRLRTIVDADPEFAVFGRTFDITGQDSFRAETRIGRPGLPMSWATVIYFSKNTFARAVFEMMSRVKKDYQYYSYLYGYTSQPYRNDFALSIALHAVSGYGYQQQYHIPWACAALPPRARVIDYDPDCGVKYLYTKQHQQQDQTYVGRIRDTDLHVMDKESILNFYDAIARTV